MNFKISIVSDVGHIKNLPSASLDQVVERIRTGSHGVETHVSHIRELAAAGQPYQTHPCLLYTSDAADE